MKKLFWVFVTVMLALTGCTEDHLVNESASNGKIQASFEEGLASRLVVGEGNALTWSSGDAFKMFNEAGSSSIWTLEGTGGTETGVFGGNALEGTLIGAAFPATANPRIEGNTLTMNLQPELMYAPGICNLPMWASFSSLDGTVSFKHLGALLKIDFTDIPKDYNSLTVTTDKAISGTFSVDLSQSEPVLQPNANGKKSVKVSFDAIQGTENNDRLFYIPLPVGEYESINVSISDGTQTLSIADWKNREIKRKKVYLASLTYRVSDATTPSGITEELEDMLDVTANATIEITKQINAADGSIEIPAEASKVGLNFTELPVTSSESPLKIEEAAATNGAQLTVSIPTTGADTYMEFNTPTITVNVNGGNYKKIVARTAVNTLVIGENTSVADLVIVAGNVVVDGGSVTGSITRDASNTDAVTYLFVENESELDGVTIGEGIKIVEDPKNVDYVTFTADNEQTLRLTKSVETLEYSVDGGLWTELGTTTVTFGGEKGTLRLRGKSDTGTAVATNDAARIVFGNASVSVAGSGDIRTLIDFQNYDSDELDTSKARFCNLFYNCTALTTAPKLPATVLASECYWQMFVYCSGLIEAPELPATTLTSNCYRYMFYGCKGLQTAPELPATTLVPGCYMAMFYECTNLKNAPKRLPASKLTAECYSNMFFNCKSLVNAPELPATILTNNCYEFMFYGCENLKEAPELPATTLAAYCYSGMFYGCSNLKASPKLPATVLAVRCYNNMFNNCTSLSEFPELPATTLADYCYTQMFYGCSNLRIAPKLPVKTMAKGCYRNMFMACTGLTVAPELPATELVDECYYGMFWECSNLQIAPELPATVLADYCYTVMFSGCTSLKEAPKLSATKLAVACYSEMFSDCTNLTVAPELPATTMESSCYNGMFKRCSNLRKAPELPATVMADYCYSSMFLGCTVLTDAPELPATVMAKGCYQVMFAACTNLKEAPKLPATKLTKSCYMMMFSECTNLNKVTMLATDVSADDCLSGWLYRVASTGTFYKNSSVTDVSAYGIPEGWEVKDY